MFDIVNLLFKNHGGKTEGLMLLFLMWIQGTIRFYVQEERVCKDVGANKFFYFVDLNF